MKVSGFMEKNMDQETLTYSNGDQYIGNFFEDNKRHSHGILTSDLGTCIYNGSWNNGRKSGRGIEFVDGRMTYIQWLIFKRKKAWLRKIVR